MDIDPQKVDTMKLILPTKIIRNWLVQILKAALSWRPNFMSTYCV